MPLSQEPPTAREVGKVFGEPVDPSCKYKYIYEFSYQKGGVDIEKAIQSVSCRKKAWRGVWENDGNVPVEQRQGKRLCIL